jgi:uncharacterized protein YaaW (UPF0174 family)
MQCMAQHRFMGESNAGIGLHNSIYRAEKGKGGPMYELYLILDRASPEERWGLAEILEMTGPCRSTDIMAEIEKKSQSIFSNLLGPNRTYHEIVCQVADKLKVFYLRSETTAEIEVDIARRVLRDMWNKMTPAEQQQVEKKLQDVAQQLDDSGVLLAQSSGIFTLLLAGKLSGFGVYLLASTSLGAITGALGVALPFVVYTTMSSAIAVILGPAGWGAAALFALWKLTGPDYPLLLRAILYVMMLRVKQEEADGGTPALTN